jgi:hypothetical protein
MRDRYYLWIFALCSVWILASALSHSSGAKAQGQFPNMDKIADKVIQKYQSSTCEALWLKKSQKAPPSPEEQRAVALLKSDPQMRDAFTSRVAAPIAGKMFECGMIP